MNQRLNAALDQLPETFRYSSARELLDERQWRTLRDSDKLTQIARGLYRKADSTNADEELLTIATRQPAATLCLRTALARHDLIDDIPASIDVAIPRGSRPLITTAPVSWHRFDAKTFDIGRDLIDLDSSITMGIYSPERSIIDAFRLRHLEGPEMANTALRAWLRQGGQPSALLRMAKHFPRAATPIRFALEILL